MDKSPGAVYNLDNLPPGEEDNRARDVDTATAVVDIRCREDEDIPHRVVDIRDIPREAACTWVSAN